MSDVVQFQAQPEIDMPRLDDPASSEANPLDLIIVGAGFAGLYALQRALNSNRSAVVLERGGDVGGTWY